MLNLRVSSTHLVISIIASIISAAAMGAIALGHSQFKLLFCLTILMGALAATGIVLLPYLRDEERENRKGRQSEWHHSRQGVPC